METNNTATTDHQLEGSIDGLHRASKTWLSEIELWRIELAFYQKLLNKISVNLPSAEEKKRLDHFENLQTYFRGEVLDQFAHDLREHEKYLGNLAENKQPFNDQLYREEHKKYADQLNAFEADFKNYRKDLLSFAGQYV
ncbi:hypothetical protein [Botryobacter ruber]|uniref:hypothetical protein n=1 Tax=Botryobacter ruber TaxID=2171629 RepID=UPI000E0CB0B2|nr:hypothetical protein [Botryobacter ruber]